LTGIAMRPMDDAERAAIFRAIEKAARVPAPQIPMEQRLASFDEVEAGCRTTTPRARLAVA
jgi:hypothetical protein